MKVLLADDSCLILERLQEMIQKVKHVEIAGSFTNGTDTLSALIKLKPDLAIVDLKMPGLSGLQVLNAIRNENKILKFIILTFCSSDYYQVLAMQSGADYFFSKVDDFDKVSLVIEEMVAKEDEFIN
ncbi:MAG: response regulator transcription factor [Bacteroidetes bacterium]|nr:response regulator transcription factor [Bacteroidota bacterium]